MTTALASRPNRVALLLLVVAVGAGGVLTLLVRGPIPQWPGYHDFADQRAFLGVPNFGNVASNLGFLIVGAAGLWALRRGAPPGGLPELLPCYRALFLGSLLVALGSSYYHWHPTNATLTWDRLSMTVAFMAFFAALLGEHLGSAWGRWSLAPLLALGALSVFYWQWTEQAGHGDLRPYALVQFLPLLCTPLILWLFPAPLAPGRYVWLLIGGYALAKILEDADRQVFRATGSMISGHSLKHVAAAGGLYFFLVALRRRRPVSS